MRGHKLGADVAALAVVTAPSSPNLRRAPAAPAADLHVWRLLLGWGWARQRCRQTACAVAAP